jgi:DhnA family fructose-bisphosphate aldolase class Ia
MAERAKLAPPSLNYPYTSVSKYVPQKFSILPVDHGVCHMQEGTEDHSILLTMNSAEFQEDVVDSHKSQEGENSASVTYTSPLPRSHV